MADLDPRCLREKLAKWDAKTDPTAPLSDEQKDSIMDLSTLANHRALPTELPVDDFPRIISVPNSNSTETPMENLMGEKHFPVKNFQEYFSWMLAISKGIEDENSRKSSAYLKALLKQKEKCTETLLQVSHTLECAEDLKEKYVRVSTSTSALHSACEHWLAEQQRLSRNADEIANVLGYFNEYDKISKKLSLPYVAATTENLIPLLNKIDDCIDFMKKNPNFKESQNYLLKYTNLLSKALLRIKTYVIQVLTEATQKVMPDIHKTVPNPTDDAFTLFYGKFRTNAPRIKSFMEQIEQRVNISEEYENFLYDCRSFYLQQRNQLLQPSVTAAVTDLAKKHARDQCALMRSGCAFMIRLCEDEYQLFFHFFSKQAPILHESLEALCTLLYDVLRPFIIHINHLETLAELCSILKVEMLEEHTISTGDCLLAFENVCNQMLQDVLERLVYRAQSYVRSEILGYKPAPGDLAYPDKLEMMQNIAHSHRKKLKGHERTSSITSTASSTSAEVARINTGTSNNTTREETESNNSSPVGFSAISLEDTYSEVNGRVVAHPNMPISPADLHGMWYPTVRRTLVCLSKLYRCVDKSTFQGLSQEALNMCIESLVGASTIISNKKTKLDGLLFLIKHLLILREQIVPFHVDFSVKETALDFSKIKDAAAGLLSARSKLFALNSNNALLKFIFDGTPQVTETFIDSKKEVDTQLKKSCENFINHATQYLVAPLMAFLDKADRCLNMSKDGGPDVKLRNQPFATPQVLNDVVAETYKKLKVDKQQLQKSMTLYLANRDTEIILIRPVKTGVYAKFQTLHSLLQDHYNEEDKQIIAAPSLEQVNLVMSTTLPVLNSNT
ncbi:DgyrCDS10413 [Dimorphilus gyrociliatus]|uniref:Conserved oligomeric Golgi complex subunit 3 n=1 Tax=Dimorphilus gyrociliatus TaxID=2664684 RepID=A0A7I8W249_9ANNE|nr:DgyrCDS10413 [Dimorphilus gyrociliatus]